MKTINILGVDVANITMEQAKEKVIEFLDGDKLSAIYTPNSEMIDYATNDEAFFRVLNAAELNIPDGIGIVYASKILGDPIKERVAGIDLVYEILPYLAEQKKSIYLLGANPGVAETAAKNLAEKHPGLVIAGTHDGYFTDDEKVIGLINEASPDFLMVCLGFPKQEFWINKYKDRLNAKVAIGAGGTLDVFAGTVLRAPEFYQKHGIEWLYRLIKQPSRFVRMLSLPKFGLKVLFKGKRYR